MNYFTTINTKLKSLVSSVTYLSYNHLGFNSLCQLVGLAEENVVIFEICMDN